MRSTYSNEHVIGFPNGDQQINTQEDPASNHIYGKSNSPYGPLYQLSNMCLEDGYSVLYGAESISDKSAAEQVLENIKNVNSTPEVLNNISKGYLTVINADSIYESAATGKSIVDFWKSNVKQTQEKLQGIKGTMIFSAPDLYFKNDKHDTFMKFEEAMGRTFSNNTSMVCWYLEKWSSDLSLASIIKVLTSHKYTIHSRWKYKQWTKDEIIDTISKGIDKALGEGSAVLLFQTMKSRYKLDKDVVVSRPLVFEGILKRVVEESADVIDSIRKEFVEHISFSKEVLLTE
jgi:hypothetical protein